MKPRLEQLEDRSLLSPTGANVFAMFDGVLAHTTDTRQIPISIAAANFALTGKQTIMLGFHLERASGSSLDPAIVQIQNPDGTLVSPKYAKNDLAGDTESIALDTLGFGNYTLLVTGEDNTAGAYHLEVYLAGDADGNRVVNQADGTTINSLIGSQVGDGRYKVAADVNLDGRIIANDLAFWKQNVGAATSINPLSATIGVRPTPILLADGTPLTNVANSAVVGSTSPGATVSLETGTDANFEEGTTTANASGNYSLAVTLNEGVNNLQVKATDAFGQQRFSSLQIILDTSSPTIAITSPTRGLATHQNISINGQVTDNDRFGVNTLQVAVDGGAFSPLSFNASGNFSFTSALILNGTADGSHTVHLQATDKAGNITVSNFSFALDTVAPTINITSPASGFNAQTNFTISGQVADALSGMQSLQAAVDQGVFSPVALDGSGDFSFTTALALDGTADGSHTVHFQAADKAGNSSTILDFVFTLTTVHDTQLPTVTIAGPAQGILVNHNVTITGQVTDDLTGVKSFQVAVDSNSFVNVALDTSGDFSFTTGLALDGSADGLHAVRLQATDGAGNTAITSYTFALDTLPPNIAEFDISPADAIGSLATTDAIVTLVGRTDPNISVKLVETGAMALTNNHGAFLFPGVSLNLGDNPLTVQAMDQAGNISAFQQTFHRVVAVNQANAVIVWNQALLQAIQSDATAPPQASRNMAMVQLAVYNAVSAIDGTPGYYVQLSAPAGASPDAAVSQAAHDVLSYLYPAQQAGFDSVLASELAQIPDGQAKSDGIALGQRSAATIIALRAGDGWNKFVDDVPGTGPGAWQPTPPMYMEALDPQWATLTPFAMTSDAQFRPAGPPALTSQQWTDAFNEVKSLGIATSSTRTADQTQIARFWADGAGSYTPPGHWNQIAGQLAQQIGDSLSADARLFAVLDIALADAAIVAWDAKYTYNSWRPVTAIRNAGQAGNPDVTTDPSWTPLLVTPNFPEYVSGHSTFSAAGATILDSFFGTNVGFSTSSVTLPGVTRSFASFDQAAAEAGQSRIYAGIHFQFANQDGQAAGRALANYVLGSFAINQDTLPPQLTLDNVLPSGATNRNITVSGHVVDNLSGVASLTVQVDQGTTAPVTFDPNGNFSVPTNFALDGSADGRHVLHFVALDAAGNTTQPVAFSFNLNTHEPVITLISPAKRSNLSAGAMLSGSIIDPNAAVTSLLYSFDGGTGVPVSFDPTTGSFNQALDLSHLALGPHTLSVSVTDSAGNSASMTLSLNQPALIPLTVSNTSPENGADDVGSTYRPKVVFSHPVDPATLSSNNFFATDTTGAKLAATIVPSADGTFAWLLFTNPMPGGSTITITVDGATIRAADGALLDAAGIGTPGSKLTFRFTTVSLANLPGTSLSGVVADPGPDLKPMTFDDLRAGADGVLMTADDVYLNPIAHAKVYILGEEDQFVYTDAQGNFRIASVPSGDIKLAIDGRTATNAPAGYYFPEMVMDLTIRPGQANTVMGSMGTREEQQANSAIPGVYLPRVATSILQTVSNSAVTTIGVDAISAPNLTPEQRQHLSIQVQPGSLIGPDGQPMASGQVGISTVSPELVRDMLPPRLLQHTFDITIQAPGVSVFSTPLAMTFPNVFNAAPGSKLNFLSFDHTTGRLVIDGTATVSADGQSVTTDPGNGITHPGWHGPMPPGSTQQNDCRDGTASGPAVAGAAAAHSGLQVGLDLIAVGIPTALAVAGGIGGGVPGAEMGFLIGEALTDGKLVFDVTDAALSAVLNGLNKEESPSQITQDVGNALVKLSLQGTLSAFDPYVKYGVDWFNLVQDSKQFLSDVHQFQQSVGAGSSSSRPTWLDPDYSATYLKMATAFGWGTPTSGQIDDFNNLANSLFAAEDLLPQSVSSLLKIGRSIGQVSDLTTTPSPTADTIASIEASLKYMLEFRSVILDFPGAMRGDIAHINHVMDPLLAIGTERTLGGPVFYAYSVSGLTIRGVTDGRAIPSAFLPPNEIGQLTVYQPRTGLVGHALFTTGSSGAPSTDGSVVLSVSQEGDTDGDGLPNDAETAIGTSPLSRDTNRDGIIDSAAINQGLDPLSNISFPTGVVASLPLQSQAKEVVAIGSTLDPQGQTAYVATGSYGLAIVNASQFQKPIVLGQIDLPGDATDVAVDPNLQIAAVATNAGGLQFVDVSDPTSPRLLRTLDVAASQVEVVNGIAYAAVGMTLQAFDILTGESRQSLPLSGSTLIGFAREGTMLYTLDSNRRLQAIDIAGFLMVARGSLNLPAGGGKLFVGNGVAYVGAGAGFVTANVSDPNNLQLLSGVDAANIEGAAVVANGSGLAVAVGTVTGPVGQQLTALDVLNVVDPTNTAAFLTRINLPVAPGSVVLAAGIAFVADGTGGLQVVNYLPFDNRGIAPTVMINTTALDIDPAIPGIQVVEGSTISVRATISDDVQVRNVELLVNGTIVSNDVSFPFDLSTIAPALAAGSSTVMIQVRATDTGGNAKLSDPMTLNLIPDNIAPVILSMDPADGSIKAQNQQTIRVRFSEAIAASTVTNTTFRLLDGQDHQVFPSDIGLRNNDQLVQLTFDTLPVDDYQLVIDATTVTDRAGNALGSANVVSHFTVGTFTAFWINPAGGDWNTASNWSTGVVPGANDDVLIDVPDVSVVITHSTGTHTVRSLATNDQFSLTGGTLTIAEQSSITNNFTASAGTVYMNGPATLRAFTLAGVGDLRGTGTVTVTGLLTWTGGRMLDAGRTVANGGMAIGGTATKSLLNSRTLDNAGAAIWTGTGDIEMNGGSVFNNLAGAVLDAQGDRAFVYTGGAAPVVNNAGTFRKSAGTASSGGSQVAFNNSGTVEALSGTLLLLAGGTSSGMFSVAAGATLGFTGHTLTAASSLSGAGNVNFTSGTNVAGSYDIGGSTTLYYGSFNFTGATVNVGGDLTNTASDDTITFAGTLNVGNALTIGLGSLEVVGALAVGGTLAISGGTVSMDDVATLAALNLTGGDLRGTGTVTVTGLLTWTGGRMLDAGRTVANGGLVISGSATKVLDSRTLDNAGAATWTGAGNVVVNNGAVFNNLAGAVFDVQTDQTLIHDSGAAVINNAGTFLKSADGGTTTIQAQFNNSGSVAVQTGTLSFNGGYTQIAGETILSGGVLTSSSAINIQSGTLSGSGTIRASVINGGQIDLGASAGSLTIAGNYTQTASGSLNIDIGGTTPGADFNQLVITGTATLGGTLTTTMVNGFTPSAGDSFEIMTFGSLNGSFASITGFAFTISYEPTGIVLTP